MPIHHLTHDTPIGANHTHIGANQSKPHRTHRSKQHRERGKGEGERERDEEDRVERVGELEQMREKMNKIMFLFLQLCYSAILHVELHCSTIANIFAIVFIYNSGC